MRIASITANPDGTLTVVRDDGALGVFDVRPYFELEAFEELRDGAEFAKVRNGGTFVEWECGADLSADTIEAKTPWTLGARVAGTPQMATTVLGKVNDAWTYSTFGDVASYTANVDAAAVFKRVYAVDALGRVTSANETIGGTTTTLRYVYDARGRLTSVAAGGAAKERYECDANGNRVATSLGTVRDVATYDAQDRLASFRGAAYAYGANRELASKTVGTQKTSYVYDALGALKSVDRPALPLIEYVTDGFGRRIAKKVGGTTTQRWLYGSALTPIAEVSATGVVAARYVYGARNYVPDFPLARANPTARLAEVFEAAPTVGGERRLGHHSEARQPRVDGASCVIAGLRRSQPSTTR